ncbi:peptidoglycan-associated lipoprotein Pal [Alphaproteobacteria bacterium]|nr:peptidoglycan-associated lipoprotein Pal [Alphaproteobacteria bacterium]
MFTRFLMIFGVVFVLAACSTPDGEMSASDEGMVGERDVITEGPLAGIYDEPISSQGLGAATQGDLEVSVGDRVFFGYDRYDLSSEARTTLENQAGWLNQNPGSNVTIEGHADERGTREYNLALGERRANSVKNYLVALGVDPRRINVISYGKERPAVPGANETAWSQNRRGVTKIGQ